MGWKLGKRQQTLLSDPQCLVHGLGEGEREGMGSFCLRSTSPSLGLRCGCWRNGEGGQISSISHKKNNQTEELQCCFQLPPKRST